MKKTAYNYIFTIHGTRGSLPVCGRQFVRHGGNTTCFSLKTPQGMMVFDAGTGINDAGRIWSSAMPLTLFFTHFHLDHVAGLAGFEPLYDSRACVTFMADGRHCRNWRVALRRIAGRPYWPLELDKFGARMIWRDLPAAGRCDLYGVRVTWQPVRHPQPCLAYRLEVPGQSIVIATDYEPDNAAGDARMLEFCRGADVLVYDAHYTPREYPRYHGWGHGHWRHGVCLARNAGVRRLILTHHAPTRTDRQIDALVHAARKVFPGARAARDGMCVRW